MTRPPLFQGCATALVTPFRGGEVDRTAFIRLLRHQIEASVDALVICGTTGESPTLTDGEKQWLFTAAVREVEDACADIPIIAGTGSNNTRRAVELSRLAEACGVDGLLVVTPSYNKASEAGLIGHYRAILEATDLPMVVYHVPGRTGCRMTPQTCKSLCDELADTGRVAGLKDATGDLSFTTRVAALCGDTLSLYAGNDDQILPVLSLGGLGVISVVSNLFPREVTTLCRLWREGRTGEAAALQRALIPLCDALFCEVNPIPVKAGLSLMGLCDGELRLPLTEADCRVRERVRVAMEELGWSKKEP